MSTPPQSALETSESLMLDSLVEALVQTRKAIAGLQAIELRVMQAALVLADEQAARLGDARQAEREMPLRAIAAEMATAVRVSDRTVQRQLSDASTFVSRFPEAVAALADGRISRSHLHVIAEAGGSSSTTRPGTSTSGASSRSPRTRPPADCARSRGSSPSGSPISPSSTVTASRERLAVCA
jgi:hypothetical protein